MPLATKTSSEPHTTYISNEEINLFFLIAYVSCVHDFDNVFRSRSDYCVLRYEYWKDDPRVPFMPPYHGFDGTPSYGLSALHPLSIPAFEKWAREKQKTEI